MGLDYAEAARALDLPLNTFKSHLLRGTKLLRERLAAKLESPDARSATVGSNGRKPGEMGELAGIPETGDALQVPERIAGG
jgi:hypothetical protein